MIQKKKREEEREGRREGRREKEIIKGLGEGS